MEWIVDGECSDYLTEQNQSVPQAPFQSPFGVPGGFCAQLVELHDAGVDATELATYFAPMWQRIEPELSQTGSVDFAITVGVGPLRSRIRVNLFRQFGGLAAAFRPIRRDPPTLRSLSCPNPVAPTDPFIAFSGDFEGDTFVSNVPNDNIVGALGCIGPQGITGCGYEAPLQAMLQAINPGALWNTGDNPFLREDAMLAIMMITDEADCSIEPPSLTTATPGPTSIVSGSPYYDQGGPDLRAPYNIVGARRDRRKRKQCRRERRGVAPASADGDLEEEANLPSSRGQAAAQEAHRLKATSAGAQGRVGAAGRFEGATASGSYNVVVTATGVAASSKTKFVRKDMLSVVVRK